MYNQPKYQPETSMLTDRLSHHDRNQSDAGRTRRSKSISVNHPNQSFDRNEDLDVYGRRRDTDQHHLHPDEIEPGHGRDDRRNRNDDDEDDGDRHSNEFQTVSTTATRLSQAMKFKKTPPAELKPALKNSSQKNHAHVHTHAHPHENQTEYGHQELVIKQKSTRSNEYTRENDEAEQYDDDRGHHDHSHHSGDCDYGSYPRSMNTQANLSMSSQHENMKMNGGLTQSLQSQSQPQNRGRELNGQKQSHGNGLTQLQQSQQSVPKNGASMNNSFHKMSSSSSSLLQNHALNATPNQNAPVFLPTESYLGGIEHLDLQSSFSSVTLEDLGHMLRTVIYLQQKQQQAIVSLSKFIAQTSPVQNQAQSQVQNQASSHTSPYML